MNDNNDRCRENRDALISASGKMKAALWIVATCTITMAGASSRTDHGRSNKIAEIKLMRGDQNGPDGTKVICTALIDLPTRPLRNDAP